MLDERHRHRGVEPRAQVEQQRRARQRRDEVERDGGGEPGAEDTEQVDIAARHDGIDDGARDDRRDEREELKGQREREHPRKLSTPHDDAEVTRERLGTRSERLERLARLEDEGNAGEGAAELREWHATPPARRIDQMNEVARDALEDEKVVEFPVEDRRLVEVDEIFDVDLHAARAEAVVARGREDGIGVGAVAIDADEVAQLLDACVATVVPSTIARLATPQSSWLS